MTSRNLTTLRSVETADAGEEPAEWSDRLYRIAYGAIGWPWLLFSLWGGTRASKQRLLRRLRLDDDALPHLGSWKADTGFLHRIVDAVEELRPATVVELGSGASSLVCARALELNGGGHLISYDQHAPFVAATAQWLRDEGLEADMRHAPLRHRSPDWPGTWYSLSDVPASIDLLVIDGPPWAVHPFVRGAADVLFTRLKPGGIVLLDDADRPGERVVARRWRRRWPDIAFSRLPGSTKGTLIGRKAHAGIGGVPAQGHSAQSSWNRGWRRAAAIAALLASGWIANELVRDMTAPAQAASFVDEASASYSASLARQGMHSQVETTALNRSEIDTATGLHLPEIPQGWAISDVQVYPSSSGMSVAIVLMTDRAEMISLFAKRAETPAETLPMLAHRDRRSVAYWEIGPFAYALTGELPAERILQLAAITAGSSEPR